MRIEIQSNERKQELIAMGWKFADGFTRAYDGEQVGVVNEHGEFFKTVPLNGWRARNLAEEMFGRREAAEMYIGRTFITLAKVLQELPGWDGRNQAIVNSFEGAVYVHVVVYDPGYGHYIRIIKA